MTSTLADPDLALAEWMRLSEELLRGLVHSLNNRITALSALGELSAMGDREFTAERVLPGELARLQQVNALFRLLASEEAPPAAMSIGPVVDDVLALHAHHTRLRAVRCEVVRGDPDLPMRVPRWAFVRLLLVLFEEGKRAAELAGRDVCVLRLSGDEQFVALRVDGAVVTPYAAAMARLCGAEAEVGDEVVRVPTLLEVRRMERLRREGTGTDGEASRAR